MDDVLKILTNDVVVVVEITSCLDVVVVVVLLVGFFNVEVSK